MFNVFSRQKTLHSCCLVRTRGAWGNPLLRSCWGRTQKIQRSWKTWWPWCGAILRAFGWRYSVPCVGWDAAIWSICINCIPDTPCMDYFPTRLTPETTPNVSKYAIHGVFGSMYLFSMAHWWATWPAPGQPLKSICTLEVNQNFDD